MHFLKQEAHEATQVANEIIDTFVPGDNESVKKCRKIAAKYIGHRVSSHTVYETDTTPIVFATGHCHIDTAWLWPFDETKRTLSFLFFSQPLLITRPTFC